MNMRLSDAGLNQIAQNEGFSPKLYSDHKGFSIGYGHFCFPQEVTEFTGKTITEEFGKGLLRQDAARAETYVNAAIKGPVTQAQFDALVDFAYNVGVVALNKVAENVNKDDFKGAMSRMMLYNKVRVNGGELVVNPGLVARRTQEVQAFK